MGMIADSVEEHRGVVRSGVVRVGDTVRRPAHEESAFVAALLEHLRREGFSCAPLDLGTDEAGRRVFEWVEGAVPTTPPYRLDDTQLRASARLIREFHDAATTFAGLGGHETVEHGDLGPHNTVFRDGTPIAVIDWDADVRPGSRAVDVAQAAWGFADLLEPDVALDRQGAALGVFCAAYDGPSPTVVLHELDARFLRARVDHAAHGRDRAVAIFDDLRRRLADGRPDLLAAVHRGTGIGR